MDIKQKKALLFVTIAALIISLFFAGNAAAAEGFKISAARVEGGAGGQVTVNITAENAAGSEGGQFNLTFDQNLVKPVSIEPGDLVLSAESNLHMANLDYAQGELMFMWVNANADTKASGVVCRVTFDLLRDGTTAISFKDVIIVGGNNEAVTAASGQIKVGAGTPGQSPTTDPEQEPNAGEDDPEDAEGSEVEEVVGEDDGESENDIVAEGTGINPFLVVIPIILIIALAVVYYLVKKSGIKKKDN
jgi:hypothetical protein